MLGLYFIFTILIEKILVLQQICTIFLQQYSLFLSYGKS